MARLTVPSRLPRLVALPAVAVISVWAGMLAYTAASGHHPIWALQPNNLAEAAAFRDGAAVIRRVEAGERLDRPGNVRERIILPEPATLMPLEAAAIAGHIEMVQVLIDLGAAAESTSWERAFCATEDESIRGLLAGYRPQGARNECDAR